MSLNSVRIAFGKSRLEKGMKTQSGFPGRRLTVFIAAPVTEVTNILRYHWGPS